MLEGFPYVNCTTYGEHATNGEGGPNFAFRKSSGRLRALQSKTDWKESRRPLSADRERVQDAARNALSAQAEVRDELAVTLEVARLVVVEQTTTLTDQLQQTATRVVVLLVLAQVLGEVVDALGEQRDLDLGGSGVSGALAELADDFGCLCFCLRH